MVTATPGKVTMPVEMDTASKYPFSTSVIKAYRMPARTLRLFAARCLSPRLMPWQWQGLALLVSLHGVAVGLADRFFDQALV